MNKQDKIVLEKVYNLSMKSSNISLKYTSLYPGQYSLYNFCNTNNYPTFDFLKQEIKKHNIELRNLALCYII